MKLFPIYLTIRLLDLSSTYLNMELTNSWERIEIGLISHFVITRLNFWLFALLNIILSIVVFKVLSINKLGQLSLKIFTVVNTLIVSINFATYFITLNILKDI